MEWLNGKIVPGHGVASGRATDSPYPDGTIRLQTPYFLQAGIDLSPYFSGTLNVDLAPHQPPAAGRVLFDGRLRWHGEIEERFILSNVEVRVDAREYQGLWYYPHPATKPAHFQRETVVELLLPFIDNLASGTLLAVRF